MTQREQTELKAIKKFSRIFSSTKEKPVITVLLYEFCKCKICAQIALSSQCILVRQ